MTMKDLELQIEELIGQYEKQSGNMVKSVEFVRLNVPIFSYNKIAQFTSEPKIEVEI